jgi:hypothetical protein
MGVKEVAQAAGLLSNRHEFKVNDFLNKATLDETHQTLSLQNAGSAWRRCIVVNQ